jgi:hypothetical protein
MNVISHRLEAAKTASTERGLQSASRYHPAETRGLKSALLMAGRSSRLLRLTAVSRFQFAARRLRRLRPPMSNMPAYSSLLQGGIYRQLLHWPGLRSCIPASSLVSSLQITPKL